MLVGTTPKPRARERPKPKVSTPLVLNATTGKQFPVVPLDALVLRILALAQAMCERKWYPYQVQFTYRLVESLLLRDGETITALLSRQSGKTEGLAGIIVAVLTIFPMFAKKYPNDWRFNLTDDSGRYRGFRAGVRIGIYAPKQMQAEIMFLRVRNFLESKTSLKVLGELGITTETSNGETIRLSNGSRLLCMTASENSKIEGQTHDLLILEEAQDISDKKIKKSLNPMVASTKGSIVMIGTATTQRCTFYETIKVNERSELSGQRKRNHFFYPHEICSQFNSLYKEYVEQEKHKIGEESDEFQMSYCCKWIFERGMFVTNQQLFHKDIALAAGQPFSHLYTGGEAMKLPPQYLFVAGIDWGRDHDSTVVTIVAVDWMNPVLTVATSNETGMFNVDLYKKHVVAWKEWMGDNYEYQFGEIQAFLGSYGHRLAKIVTDDNGAGKPIYDRLVAVYSSTGVEVVPFNFQPKLKSDGYKALYQEICGRRLTFPADRSVITTINYRKFINQTLDLRKSYKNGLMCVAHPEEKHAHDDYPDSLMLANWGTLIPLAVAEVDFSDSNFFFRR